MDFVYLSKVQPTKNGLVYDHSWVTVDRFSKQTLPVELPEEATAEDLVRIFWTRIYPVFGIPKDIVSDRDTRFTSQIWKSFCLENDIHQSMSSAYHPETDGQTEIANKDILAKCRALLEEQGEDWINQLGSVQMAINNSLDATRGATPISIYSRFTSRMKNQPFSKPQEEEGRPDGLTDAIWNAVRNQMAKRRVQMAEQANKRRRPTPEFSVGQLVLVYTDTLPVVSTHPKLEPKKIGPFPIIRAYPATDNYTLRTPNHVNKGQLTVHVSQLEEWYPNNDQKFPGRANPQPGPVPEIQDEERYEIEHIYKHFTYKNGNTKFFVKWKGWGPEWNQWVWEQDMDTDAVQEYINKKYQEQEDEDKQPSRRAGRPRGKGRKPHRKPQRKH